MRKTLHNREVYNLREYFLKVNDGMHRELAAADKGIPIISVVVWPIANTCRDIIS